VGNLQWTFAWINTIDSQKFDDLLEHMPVKMPPGGFVLPQLPASPISVIHLRIEDDYTKHVATNMLNIPQSAYRSALISAWQRAIVAHIPRTDIVIVLCYMVHGNPLLDFMRRVGYKNLVMLPKRPGLGREVNAAADLVAGVQLCNHVFIGCWNQENLRGSTFSYVIARQLKARQAAVKLVLLDSEQIIRNPHPEVLPRASILR
jgi:hypothetical protein